ncbi:NUMOD4 domain-containing protein [Paenibacillus elgii]|uniref:NUMOD4 domain-containing protein n=1 Tax=Paenibacillus elgii TaxID=189691 RepID=UPI000248CFB2|nr:NUMOD4 domain-containing protein [Paenibacillus elgii]
MEKEIWKQVNEVLIPSNKFGHTYSVSNFGRVRNDMTGRILKKQLKKHEYEIVDLSGKQYKVHRLVAKLFVANPKPEEYDAVNHIDLDKTNNHYTNLEWCDHDYNIKHASLNGALKDKTKGENNGRARLSEEDVLDIWIYDRSIEFIVSKFGVSENYADRLKRKYTWKHLIRKYKEMVSEDHEDKLNKKRKEKESQRKRKLTDEQVYEIYLKTQTGSTNVYLAKMYDVGKSLVSNIRNKKELYIEYIINKMSI